jgi:hypothetical protein
MNKCTRRGTHLEYKAENLWSSSKRLPMNIFSSPKKLQGKLRGRSASGQKSSEMIRKLNLFSRLMRLQIGESGFKRNVSVEIFFQDDAALERNLG